MNTNSVTLSPLGPEKDPCPCGCAPCKEQCCRLDCLERPRFFCGQLLTDQDLAGLVGWTQDKLRLARFRHGWGVVCGLDVRCNPDPKQPASVLVDPGYAVSCCGDDIIVCEETCFDLSDACRQEPDPCEELRKEKNEKENEYTEDSVWPADSIRSIDLFIHYDEQLTDPQTAFARSVCREVSECEYGRTREAFELRWKSAMADPLAEAEKKWLGAYRKCWDIVDEFDYWRTPNRRADRGLRIREWFLRHIAENSLRHFCFLRDWICMQKPEKICDEAAKLLFVMSLDCLSQWLSCQCYECEKGSGVPLARVHLYNGVEDGTQCCRVLSIDPYSPYRRIIESSCWPARRGRVNLAGAIMREPDDAVAYLRGLNIEVMEEVYKCAPDNAKNLDEVKNRLCEGPIVSTNERVTLSTFDFSEEFAPLGRVIGERVVGIAASGKENA